MILAGDIGGTNTRLALFTVGPGGSFVSIVERRVASREHAGLVDLVRAFMAAEVAAPGRTVDVGGFGIAGPVRDGRVETTNLPWVVDAREMAREIGIGAVSLLNDLEANAFGIPALEAKDLATLQPGAPGASGNQAVISAGTGLGEAGAVWDGGIHAPFATEGGHAGFAPASDLEVELRRWLAGRGPHVSCEHVLSGPGLKNIYDFLRDTARAEEPPWLREEIASTRDASEAISKAALAGRAEICVAALDLFVRCYGSEAGNLALRTLATGGVFVGGGIAPKILPKLQDGAFVRAFAAKGRMQALLEAIPVRVVLNDRTALIGAARAASLGARAVAL